MKLIINYFDAAKRRKHREFNIFSLDYRTWPKQALKIINSFDNVVENIYYVQFDMDDYKRLESG